MKFIVSRTSMGSWNNDYEKLPCEEAKQDKIMHMETYNFHTPEDFDNRVRPKYKWLDVGTNHRVNEEGFITRDMGMINVWSMELNTIDELLEFCRKYGEVVIKDCIWNKTYKEIEIYDDYRE